MVKMEDYDTDDSDPPVRSIRRPRPLALHADLYDSSSGPQTEETEEDEESEEYDDTEEHSDSEVDDDGEEDHALDNGNKDDKGSRSPIGGKTNHGEDDWSRFARSLRRFETDANICRLYPKSLHVDWQPPVPPSDERELLYQVIAVEADISSDHKYNGNDHVGEEFPDYEEVPLHDFVIYRSVHNRHLKGHMESLHIIASEQHAMDFYFDGYVEHKGIKKYLERIPIKSVNIGGQQYEGQCSMRDQIYLQSDDGYRMRYVAVDRHVWYNLGKPATEYSDIYNQFLWVAEFLKHFVDYLTDSANHARDVCLEDFRSNFSHFLLRGKYSENVNFQHWHERCGFKRDLAQYVARHARFLRDQVWSLGDTEGPRLLKHCVWQEICPEAYPSTGKNFKEQTVVTRNTLAAFGETFPVWGFNGFDLLRVVHPCEKVERCRRERMLKQSFPDKYPGRYNPADGLPTTMDILEKTRPGQLRHRADTEDIVGRVVVVRRHDPGLNDPGYTYAYVRNTCLHKRQEALSVVWLAQPKETICGSAYYPIGNELFLSRQECCCTPVLLSKIMGVYGVSMLSDHADSGATFFVRESYSEECFVTAQPAHLQCSCKDIEAAVDQAPGSPKCKFSLLDNLSLFAGCGLFDRGLEEGGVLQTTYAIEYDGFSMQSYKANQRCKGTNLTCSVNECLDRLLRGLDELPRPDCISAGCPCQGFSALNIHKASEKSQRNCSLIASTVSYIETLLPLYGLIENVPGMDTGSPNACEQVICTLVALGYQVRKALLKASQFEAPQNRPRLFILIAAPGLPLPRDPLELAIDGRVATVASATAGLSKIDNDIIINIESPDHIPLKRLQPDLEIVNLRSLVAKIPTKPPSMNLAKTEKLGLLNQHERDWLSTQSPERRGTRSRALQRVDPTKPFPTVVTSINPMCSRIGVVLHPFENRVLSLQEQKIAQGFLETDVLIGPLSQQLKQCGNGVARPVGVALGRVIGESWLKANSMGLIPRSDPLDVTLEDNPEEVKPITDGVSALSIESDERPEQLHMHVLGEFDGRIFSERRDNKRKRDTSPLDSARDEVGLSKEAVVNEPFARRRRYSHRPKESALLSKVGTTEDDPIELSD